MHFIPRRPLAIPTDGMACPGWLNASILQSMLNTIVSIILWLVPALASVVVAIGAGELIWRTLFDGSFNGQADAMAELRNDSSRDMSIRKTSINLRAGVAADDDEYAVELSTDPTYTTSTVNGDPGWRSVVDGETVFTTSGFTQTGISKTESFGKGQLILEPGESIYLNGFTDASMIGAARAVIGWEFV